MADPEKYEPSYAFSGSSPSALSGAQLDIQFAGIAQSTASIVDAVKDVRRSDGQVKNGSIGPDQLSPALSIGFSFRGVWSSGADYSGGDGAVFGTGFYKARLAHKASAANRPDVDPKTWTFLVETTFEALEDESVTPEKISSGRETEFQQKFGLVVGQDVQAYNANTVLSDAINTFTATQDMGSFSGAGASAGIRFNQSNNWAISLSRGSTALSSALVFINPNGTVGSVQISANSTAYNTSSDERLKEFTGEYDPLDAVAIIRADPVRTWKWLSDGAEGVGWGAQSSFEVSADLASPGQGDPSDDAFVPWGVDQSRRTPYLWAALSLALDRIDQLEQRLNALEANTEGA